jgi:TetR/AcrR family transcriptional regulator, lmrAB and yxaGH operons repressor
VSERADVVPALIEVFRHHGFQGASLAVIAAHTGLGKGSLYHFFPGGKDEMARAVLAEIAAWFEREVFAPLRAAGDPRRAIRATTRAIHAYFAARHHVCLFGAFALDGARDRFAAEIRAYFAAWAAALAAALRRLGLPRRAAARRAVQAVGEIQGALVVCRALDDPAAFDRALAALADALCAAA